MRDALVLGLIFGLGAALAVGPIFVTIIYEAATHGFRSSFKVILGSAVADLLLLFPALALSWLIARIDAASAWVGATGALFFVYLGVGAGRDAWRLWHGTAQPSAPTGWSFWKGVLGNLLNPLTWSFWLATGTPTMLHAYNQAGWSGLALFTAVWFITASGLEAVIALIVVKSGRLVGPRGMALFNGFAATMFMALAAGLIGGIGLPWL
jgi:threonine/homoserine/homoserine lactone efflux protein